LRLLPKGRARIAVVIIAALALVAGGLEIYSRQPVAAPTPALDLPADISTLVLVIHGSADENDPLLKDIVAGLQARYQDTPHSAVRFVNWAPASDQRLRSAATAQAVGGEIGAMLGRLGTLRELHLIAHSSGAFMPDAICAAYRAASTEPARVTMVLLDPFQIRGFVDWTYGAREHGRCGDFTLSVFNTDDPAPATNRALARAFNLDITAQSRPASFTRNGHYWPLQYYRDQLLPREPEIGRWAHAAHPRGTVQIVRQESGRN
jgi:hypothetical protein